MSNEKQIKMCKNCLYRNCEEKNCNHRIMREVYFGVKIDEKHKCDWHEFKK